AVMHHRMHAGEIVEWRRGRDAPFECRRFPGISRRFRALLHAPDQVDHEYDLGCHGEEGGVGYEGMDRHKLAHEFDILEVRVAAWIANNAQEVHRCEDRVDPNERQVKVNLAERLVHHAAEHLGEPVKRPGEHAKDGRYAHDHVEVSDYERRVVEVQIERGLAEE